MTPRWDPPGKLTWLKGKAEVAPGTVFHTMVSFTVVAMVLLNTVAMVGKRIFFLKMTAVKTLICRSPDHPGRNDDGSIAPLDLFGASGP